MSTRRLFGDVEMDYPDRNELVVVKITQVLDYGVFVELLEYGNRRGFVHISNVSSSWVKNIRNLVKMNQVRVAKVLNIDLDKKQIDLSFASISPQREKQKMVEFKQVNREEKLIALLAKQEKKEFDETWEQVADPLIEEYGSLYKAFEKVALGEDINKLIEAKWLAPVKELVEKNIVVSEKTLKGILKLSTLQDDGLELVKQVLKEIEAVKGCSVLYKGAGVFVISCSSPTFKETEKTLKSAVEKAENKAKKTKVSFAFELSSDKKRSGKE
ncbi:MAG: S1 RNA-binding domain-containing protein [Candidatus Diapherotrites archaeon]|nr:S1 RNA-binding domain-containing protein [Candidatus Diapherotrites archaeon]